MVPIEISSYRYLLLNIDTHYRPILHRLAIIHNAADRQTDRAMANGRLCYRIGGLKTEEVERTKTALKEADDCSFAVVDTSDETVGEAEIQRTNASHRRYMDNPDAESCQSASITCATLTNVIIHQQYHHHLHQKSI